MDPYGHLLRRVLFPAFEAVRGRPTTALLRYLQRTQWASRDELHAIQSCLLRRVLTHAYRHTAWYRRVFDERGVRPEEIAGPEELAALPLLEKADARTSLDARLTDTPPWPVVRKTTSGSTGQPMTVVYNAESRHWRDATRWRGYGWAGYQPGHRALHFWGAIDRPPTRLGRAKLRLDRRLNRNLYVDCAPRGDADLARVVATLRSFRPDVIVTHSQAGAELARFVVRSGERLAGRTPVICSAERLFDHDRDAIEAGLGPAFEVYGSREFMMTGAECEAHDGLHVPVETLITEIVVREPDGTVRPARPGETGEVVVTDLHNLAAPMIRYVTGDLAVQRADAPCACGRGLPRIGPIDGRTVETVEDAGGRPVSGHVFSILFLSLADHCRQYQVHQRADRSVTIRIVPITPGPLPAAARQKIEQVCARYLGAVPVTVEVVDEIPTGPAGKRKLVVVERPRPAPQAA